MIRPVVSARTTKTDKKCSNLSNFPAVTMLPLCKSSIRTKKSSVLLVVQQNYIGGLNVYHTALVNLHLKNFFSTDCVRRACKYIH
jgi:hypothetical protein